LQERLWVDKFAGAFGGISCRHIWWDRFQERLWVVKFAGTFGGISLLAHLVGEVCRYVLG
jgi:hypothetical protein